MADPLLSFLTLLVGPEPDQRLLEVRYRTNGRPGMGQHFISASAPIIASDLIRPLSAHGDTYVGVLLRDRAHGGRSAVTSSHLLWVEVDAPNAYRQLLSAPAAPTAVVSSGVICSGRNRRPMIVADGCWRHVANTARRWRPR